MKIKHKDTGEIIYDSDLLNLKYADLRCTNLTGANLIGKNLTGVDLTGVSLRGANLTGADLTYASLRGADLTGANLTGADLTYAEFDTHILFICGSCDYLQLIGNELRIGCEVHSIDYWLKNYKEIGKKYKYTEDEIKEYCKYIKMVASYET